MNTLLIRLAGPMQSWGTQSRFTERDTGLEPSKSGVIGLLCAALGRPRSEPLDDLSALRMGVRVDREGIMKNDFHTVGGGSFMGKPYGCMKASGKKPTSLNNDATELSNRHYLSDASFLVGLESPDLQLLEILDTALANPHWPLCLGRKSFPPGCPVGLPGGLKIGTSLEESLKFWPWSPAPRGPEPAQLRVVIDPPPGESGDSTRCDVPVSFENYKRDFRLRSVKTLWVDTSGLAKGDDSFVSITPEA